MKNLIRLKACILAIALFPAHSVFAAGDYGDLLVLFDEWRAFEQPPLLDGAPDYRPETVKLRHQQLKGFQDRLLAMDISSWSVENQIDHYLVRAEMNGMDFNTRVLQPWVRDPAFYTSVWTFKSDTPDHEGPTHHAIIELWQYSFPLDADAEKKLTHELESVPPLLTQARGNLIGNARELWTGGIKNLRDQANALVGLELKTTMASNEFKSALAAAVTATREFITWLEAEAENKTGPSGIGIEDYTWHLQNVHLIPMTWEDEVRLLQRELDRAWSSLKLEEHRNRNLPPLVAIGTEDEYLQRTESAVLEFRDFLRDENVLPAYEYIEPALRGQMGAFVPETSRNFFWTVAHYEPLALWTHWYHWFDLARMESNPNASPVRRGAMLYNIWDSRAEGMATGFEEVAMQAGIFDAKPRARELVWIMLAQRAARGLGSLQAHANRLTLKEARDFHVAQTPRGWMREDLDLLGFEQLLYLRQPGYGTSYITGKYLLERLMAEMAKRDQDGFELSSYFAELDEVGVIPVSMIQWQMTGVKPAFLENMD